MNHGDIIHACTYNLLKFYLDTNINYIIYIRMYVHYNNSMTEHFHSIHWYIKNITSHGSHLVFCFINELFIKFLFLLYTFWFGDLQAHCSKPNECNIVACKINKEKWLSIMYINNKHIILYQILMWSREDSPG